jgi:hypothetical protein
MGLEMMSGSYGMIWMLLMVALLIVPFWKILPRSGIPAWVAIFAIFPPVALILLWVVAFKDQVTSAGGRN